MFVFCRRIVTAESGFFWVELYNHDVDGDKATILTNSLLESLWLGWRLTWLTVGLAFDLVDDCGRLLRLSNYFFQYI